MLEAASGRRAKERSLTLRRHHDSTRRPQEGNTANFGAGQEKQERNVGRSCQVVVQRTTQNTRHTTQHGNFKDVRFYPILNFGLFWAALLKISVFYQFWANHTFSAWPFLGRPFKDVRFYPILNFG